MAKIEEKNILNSANAALSAQDLGPGDFFANGWGKDESLLLQDDISTVAFWYQTEFHSKFPDFPDRLML
jgi:hypothetical protein